MELQARGGQDPAVKLGVFQLRGTADPGQCHCSKQVLASITVADQGVAKGQTRVWRSE